MIDVPCVTLDSIAGELGQFQIPFIDAEGAELAIRDGARPVLTSCRPAIMLEASPQLLKRSGAGCVPVLVEKGVT